MTSYSELLRVLQDADVRFIVIGGVAGIGHGSARFTQDVDVVYERSPDNVKRLVEALRPLSPYPRGAPPGLPFLWDERTVLNGLNFTLTTDLGWLDLLGEIVGGGAYGDLVPHSEEHELFDRTHLMLDLPTLIRVKRAAGRPKDFEAIAELEALLEERQAAGLDSAADDSNT